MRKSHKTPERYRSWTTERAPGRSHLVGEKKDTTVFFSRPVCALPSHKKKGIWGPPDLVVHVKDVALPRLGVADLGSLLDSDLKSPCLFRRLGAVSVANGHKVDQAGQHSKEQQEVADG